MNFKKFYMGFFLFVILICSFFTQADAVVDIPTINSGSVVLLENSTSKVLFEKDMNKKLEPASITKIMTAILAIENCNLNDIVTVPYEAISNIPSGYSVAPLQADEQISVDQLLRVLMVHSANDAANALAFHIDGSVSAFAERMNAKLQALGLADSHFTNPSGQHDDNHYSTAHDIAILMQYCMKNTTFKTYASLKSCHLFATNKSAERDFENTNPMLNTSSSYYYKPLVTTKTGFTSQAMFCLASFASYNNLDLICVILHADTSDIRFNETKNLFDYGFQNFAFKNIANKGDSVTEISVRNATEETKSLKLVLADDINTLVDTSKPFDNVSPQITLKDLPSAPVAQGNVLGTATYVIDDKSYVVNLLASHDVQLSTSRTYFLQIILLVIVVIILILLLFFWNTGKKKEELPESN